MIPLPHPMSTAGGGELRRGCRHDGGLLTESQSGEPRQAGNPRPMTRGTRCLLVCDTKSDDGVREDERHIPGNGGNGESLVN